jgi:hypothetical protein
LTWIVASVLAALSLGYSLRVLVRCRALSETTITEQDELEKRLAEKALALQLGLGRRMVRALARATLFSGTGLAVWELTGGSSHYPQAAIGFVVGFAGWAGCGEVERRLPKLNKRPGGRMRSDDL